METKDQTIQQPKCSKGNRKKSEKSPISPSVLKEVALVLIRSGLRELLMNPTVWNWMTVHVPEYGAKAWEFLVGVVAHLKDFLD